MSVTLVGSTTSSTVSTLVNPAWPAGIATGDIAVLVCVDGSGANVVPAPTGWTKQAEWNITGTGENLTVHLYTHTYTAGDTAANFNLISSGIYTMAVFRGASGVGGIGTTSAVNGTTTITYNSITLGSGGGAALAVGGSNHKNATTGSINVAPPSGWTQASEAAVSDSAAVAVLNAIISFATFGPNAASGTVTSTLTNAATDSAASASGVQLWLAEANTAPTAPTGLAPSGAATIDLNSTQRFSWTFNDPDLGDTQSKFDLHYRVGSAAWTTVTATTTSQFYDFAAGTFTANNYEWQVRTYDSQGVQSPWSASAFFTAGSPPNVPAITSPTNGSTVAANTGTISWSAPSQDSYEVRKVADNGGAADTTTVYYDTAEVVSSSARSAALTFPTNNRYEHLQVRLKVSGLWSSWADVRVQVSYTPPATPTITLTANLGLAAIVLTPTQPTPTGTQPAVTSMDVWRRRTLVGGAGERIAAGVNATAAFYDYTPAGGVDYEYQVVANGNNSTSTASAWTGASNVAVSDPTAYSGY